MHGGECVGLTRAGSCCTLLLIEHVYGVCTDEYCGYVPFVGGSVTVPGCILYGCKLNLANELGTLNDTLLDEAGVIRQS